jgi:dTDP-glucose 4,6-dehydratase
MTKILVTGGNGFIGSHVCEHILKNTDWDLDILDSMNYASSGYDRLKEVNCYDDKRIRHFSYDITLPISEGLLKELYDCSYIVHLAAETHVNNSISNPEPFVRSNVLGTMQILEFARKCQNLKKIVYFSTDEVFGPAPIDSVPNGYKEWDRYNSTNPYSASKAGGEELCLAWANTYKVPVIITHTMNVFGERQHVEKYIPMTIKKILTGEKVLIHSDASKTKPGSRFWIHARNVASAVMFLLKEGEIREKYNIVGEREVDNLQMAQFISEVVGKPLSYELIDFHSSRPGHDLRYALNGEKLRTMGHVYPKTFEDSLIKTIQWTVNNPKWLS